MNIDESKTAKGYTPAALVPQVFGGPRTLDWITIHWWGAFGQTHDGVVNFFVNGPGTTSAHFVCSAGRTTCLVSPQDAAWHAGSAEGNRTSVGIECRPEASDQDYQEVANLVSWLRSTTGRPLPLRPHKSWHPTACPGGWDLERLDAMARAIGAPVQPASDTVKPSPTPKPTPAPVPAKKPRTYPDSDIHWVVERGDTLGKIAAYYNGPTVAQIAAYNNIDANKIAPGQKIWIPGPLVWVIEKPDTVRSIARYYGLDPAYLARLNGLAGPDATIYIGRRLTIKK